MAATSVYIPWGTPSCLLPFQEALQDQLVGLTQAPLKLLPLCWDSECVILQSPFKSKASVSYNPPAVQKASRTGLQSRRSGDCILGAGSPGWGVRCGAQTHCFLERTSIIVFIVPFVGRLLGVWVLTILYCVLLMVSLWLLLYIFSRGKSFLLVFRLFS